MCDSDLMNQEMMEERVAAMQIVVKLKAVLKVKDAVRELDEGHWWDPGPRCHLKGALREFTA